MRFELIQVLYITITCYVKSGISIGEIGPKLGLNSVNNGYLGLNKVRIPRDQMLMKNAQVAEVFLCIDFIMKRYPTIFYYQGWNVYQTQK